nr:hypothetical protein [Tanacetum cinerariifolium]
MTRSIVKRLTEPLDEPEREFRRLRRAALRSHQNDSLAIAERNLFDEEASSGPHEADKYKKNNPSEQGNTKHKEKGGDSPEWTVRCKFEDELANFMLKKKLHAKRIGDMLVQHRKGLREQYSQILSAIDKSITPEPEAPTLAITTRLGISTRDPPFPAPPRPATNSFTEKETKKPENTKKSSTQEPVPQSSILYQPSEISDPPFSYKLKKQKKDDEDESLLSIFKQIHINLPFLDAMIHMPMGAKVLKDLLLHKEKLDKDLPFPYRLKRKKKDDEDESLLSIFKQIHINLPFLEAMIHMPKGAKVLKDLLSHKEKIKKAASSVKLSEKCSVIIQKNLPQKERDPGSFTLPCLIGPLAVKNALADLRASINLMPHSLFQRLGISKLKPTKMSIQLADRSIKYPIGVCENLLVKVGKFIFF